MKIFGAIRDKAYNLLPYVAKAVGFLTIWTRKIMSWMVWIGLVALVLEVCFRQWGQIWPTITAMAASMAFTEAQKMRKSFKAWGFEEGPGNVNSN